jgi:hypothetical protein
MRSAADVQGLRAPPIVAEVLRTPGRALDHVTRGAMETHFRADFGRVRVHTDEPAARSTDAVGALAYTVGEHIFFGHGLYRPEDHHGRSLLVHELAHVTQQSAAPSAPADLRIGPADDAFERHARRVAAAGEPGSPHRLSTQLLQRQLIPTEGSPVPLAGPYTGLAPFPPSPPPPPIPNCLGADVCKPPICGSSWEFAHRVEEQEKQHRGERKKEEQEGKAPIKPDSRPAQNLTEFARKEAPEALEPILAILTSPEVKSAQNTECDGGQCIVVTEKLEAEAGQYLGGAKDIGTAHRARADWRANARRVLAHEATHAGYEVARPSGFQINDEISLFELGELNSILSEVPIWYGHLLQAPASDATSEQKRKAWDMWIESCGEGLRGILQKLRCLNPCSKVAADVKTIAGPRIASWPANVRAAFLAEVKDPAREDKAPPERKLRWPTS